MSTRRALAAAFVANGMGGPSFLARLPERQRDLDLSDAALGAVVLGMAVGALLASPVAGWAVHRFGSRSVTAGAGIAIGATLWLTAAAPTAPTLFLALAVVGAGDAAMDIAMNANGAAHEATTGRSTLHGLHAAWSLGALVAAGLAAAAAATDVSLGIHLGLVGGAIALLAAAARPGLVADDPSPPPVPVEHRPRRIPAVLVALGAATAAAAILEGAPGEWSAVQLDRFGVSDGVAPLGTAAFMAGMVAGRLVNDRRTDRHGGTRVLRQGMALCAAGLALGAVWGEPLPFVIGAALAGFGVSGFFPLAFSAASRVPGVSGGAGAAVVSLAARAGFLVEPVLVGSIAQATDLRVSFGLVAAVALGLAVAAPRITNSSARGA